jgi:hypothetical protein
MKCAKCGTELADNTRFCSNCGLTLARSEEKSSRRTPKKPIIAALIAIGVLCLAALVFALLGPKNSNRSLLQGQSKLPAPSAALTQSEVNPPGPSHPLTQSDAPKPPSIPAPVEEKAPPEVVQYLQFVKGIELRRQNMRTDFNPALDMLKSAYGSQLGLDMDEDDSATKNKVNKGYSKYVQDWNQVLRDFNSVQAPEPCRDFAAAYQTALSNYVVTMVKIQVALSQQDINTLMAMKGKAQRPIDQSLKQADQQLENVTKRYKLEKDFSVEPDQEVDTIFGGGGL